MKIRFKNISTIVKTAYKEWMSKDPFRESAASAQRFRANPLKT
jgi:hypothetical protein